MPRRYPGGRVEKTRGATSKGNNPFFSIMLNKSSLHIEEMGLRASKNKGTKKTSFEPKNISSIIVKNGSLSSSTLSTTALIPNKALPKMQRFLQDERFRRDELPKLLEEEKRQALDVKSEIDFTIKPRETVKLVAWIRFHSLYHSGKLQIRFRSDKNGFVILVRKPTLILRSTTDGTCDIQEMKDQPNTPAFIKQLLDPYLQTEVVRNVYAFLLCDYVRWKWIGCFNRDRLSVQPPTAPSSKQPEEATSLPEQYELDKNDSETIPERSPTLVVRPTGHNAHWPLPAPSFSWPQNLEEATPNFPPPTASSSSFKSKAMTQFVPEVILEEYSLPEEYGSEQNTSEAIPELSSSTPAVVPKATIAKEPSTKKRSNLKVVEQRRKQLKERHPYITSNRLSIIATNTSTPLRPTSGSSDPLYILPDEIPEQSASSQSNGCDSILPGSHLNGNDSLLRTDTAILSQYPAVEKLVMFSRQVMSNLSAVIGLKSSPFLPTMSTHELITPLTPGTNAVLAASSPAPLIPSVGFGKQEMKQRSSQNGFIIPTITYYPPNGTK